MARRAGTGDPPSVTLNTSMDLRSGLLFPCRFNIGESTRFRGGSTSAHRYTHAEFQVEPLKKHVDCNAQSMQTSDLESISQQLHLIADWSLLRGPAAIKWFVWPVEPAGAQLRDQAEPKTVKVKRKCIELWVFLSAIVILANKSKPRRSTAVELKSHKQFNSDSFCCFGSVIQGSDWKWTHEYKVKVQNVSLQLRICNPTANESSRSLLLFLYKAFLFNFRERGVIR